MKSLQDFFDIKCIIIVQLKDEPEHASEVETIGGTIEQGAPQVKVSGEIELVVNVLTMGFWPTYPAVEVNLPKEVCMVVSVLFALDKWFWF